MMDSISKTFNVNPIKKSYAPAVRDDSISTIVSDANDGRSNLKDLLDVGGKALQEALAIAIESEDSKSFEVVATLMSTMAELNSRIMAIHSMEQKLTAESSIKTAVQNNTTTNNIVFSGTTSELSKLLNKENI